LEKARSVPLFARSISGDMATNVAELGEEVRCRSKQNGPSRPCKDYSSGPPDRPQMVGGSIPPSEGDVSSQLDFGSIRKEGEKVVGFDISKGNGISTRCIGKLASVSEECRSNALENEPGMEDGVEGCGRLCEAEKTDPGEGGDMEPDEKGYHVGGGEDGEGCIGGNVGDRRERGGHYEVTCRRNPGNEIPDEGPIHYRENGVKPTLYCEFGTCQYADTKICDREEEKRKEGSRGRTCMVISSSHGQPSATGVTKGTPGSGNEISKTGSSPSASSNGFNRYGADGLLPAPQYRDATPLLGFRMGIRGGGGTQQEGCSSGLETVSEKKKFCNKTPDYVRKNYMDPPSWEDMQKAFPNNPTIQRAFLELNVSRVAEGSIEKLLELDFLHEECKNFLINNLRILNDENLYKSMVGDTKAPNLPKPSLSAMEIEKLLNYKLELSPVQPLWGTLPFKVAEPHKNRCRAIFDCNLNSIFKDTPKYHLKSKTEIRRGLNSNLSDFIFLQFDFKSFYDQILLSKKVRKYFGFQGHNNLFYVLKLLPMGFRLAVACAQSIMWALLNFKKDDRVMIATCIDNVCFAGPREDVYKAATRFLERVEKCNFTLHGFEKEKFTPLSEEKRRSVLKKLEDVNPEFLGEKYNLVEKTRAISKKTVDKLEVVWSAIGPHLFQKSRKITHRQFFCLIGIVVYASDVLDIKTHTFFNLFRKIRILCEKLSTNKLLWDAPLAMELTRVEFEKMEKWVTIILKNNPVGLLRGRKEIPTMEDAMADIFIVTDASKDGWGAIFFDKSKKFTHFRQGIWPRGDYRASSKAEPLGIEKTIKQERDELKGKRIVILTDHENLVFASRALFVHSFYYNKILTYLEQIKKEDNTQVFIYYVKGKNNNADGVSRGQRSVVSTAFPDVGTGLEMALPIPWQL